MIIGTNSSCRICYRREASVHSPIISITVTIIICITINIFLCWHSCTQIRIRKIYTKLICSQRFKSITSWHICISCTTKIIFSTYASCCSTYKCITFIKIYFNIWQRIFSWVLNTISITVIPYIISYFYRWCITKHFKITNTTCLTIILILIIFWN